MAKWGGILAAAGAILCLPLLNLFLATPIGRGLVAKKVSGAMRMPVLVGSASYTPWGGVRLRDLRVEQIAAAQGIVSDPFFEAASFEADVRLLSLLGDKVVIDRLVCDAPKFSLVRGQEARAPAARPTGDQLPAATADRPGGAKPGNGAETEKRPEAPATSTSAPPSAPVVAKPRRKISLGEVEVRGGSLLVSSLDGDEVLRVEGLKMFFDLSEPGAQGKLTIDRATLAGTLEVTEFASPVVIEGPGMKLLDLRAQCGGGEIGGELVIERQAHAAPFVAKLTARGIDVAQIIDGKSLGLRSAKVAGELDLRGIVQSPKSIEGVGQLRVESAVLEPGEELDKLRRAMEVDGEGRVKLDPARAIFAIRGGVLGLQDASFGSGRILVKSVGGVRLDGALNIATRLYLGADLYSGIRSKPAEGRAPLRFEHLEGTDWFYRDEQVTGTLGNPLLDFWRTGSPLPAADVFRELSFDFGQVQGDAIGR